MLASRAPVVLLLGPVSLLLVYLGGWFLFFPIVIYMTLATAEYVHMVEQIGWKVPLPLLLPFVWLPFLLAQLPASDPVWHVAPFFGGLLLSIIYAIWRYDRHNGVNVIGGWLAFIGGMMLLGFLGSHMLLLRNLEPATGSVFWRWTAVVMIATWLADTFAFLVGSYVAGRGIVGRHPLTPRLSPKKTVEGLSGGVLLATTAAVLVGVLLFRLDFTLVLLLSLFSTIIGAIGDLSISLLKRESGVKDSGRLFPGHGGALDRIDSLIWAFAFAYYFFNVVKILP